MVSAMILSLFTLVGCTPGKEPSLKLGLGVVASASATDATADKEGQGKVTTTVATVLVDDAGKIVKAFIDSADNKVTYTAEGKANTTESFKTKYELGADYHMVAYGGAAKEWFEQADAFCTLIVGKTADEVKALITEDDKSADEVIKAGCTIGIADFVKAVDKAISNATASKATKNDTLKLGIFTAQTAATDATEEKQGSDKVTTTFFAAAVDANGKIVAATSDCVEVTFKFDTTGKTSYDASSEVLSKKEQGDNYGMKAYGGSAKEWYEQAAEFDAACIGKSASEISGLIGTDGKGNADLQTAGCTITIDGFVKAASKIG